MKCDIDMKIGTALWPFDHIGRASFWIASMGPLLAKLIIPCWKCFQCGKSEELSKEFNLDKYIDRDIQFSKTFLEPVKSITEVISWQPEYVSTLEDFFN